jgi:hypothetical protein
MRAGMIVGRVWTTRVMILSRLAALSNVVFFILIITSR